MSYTVVLNSDLSNVLLPNQIRYDGGSTVVLSDAEFSLISTEAQSALFSSVTPNGGGGGSGTVTTASVAAANGFAGTVTNPTTTPAITVETSVTGLLKGNGTAVSAATAGTDYLAPNGNGSALTGLTEGQISGLSSDLAAKAPLASPAFTGNPTAATQSPGNNSTRVATTAYTDAAVAARVVSGQYLCAPSVYAPGTRTTLSVTTTTMAAWSTGNVCTNSFVAPASGSVMVTFSGVMATSASGNTAGLALAAKGTVTPVVGQAVTIGMAGTTVPFPVTVQFLVTGLTPGSSYQFDLLGAVTSAATAFIYAQGQSSTALASPGGPAVMTVQAV